MAMSFREGISWSTKLGLKRRGVHLGVEEEIVDNSCPSHPGFPTSFLEGRSSEQWGLVEQVMKKG